MTRTATGTSHSTPSNTGEWWRDAVIYQVYPRSFADGNGDGTGDLPGITAHLGHVRKLGVDAVWLSPFYRSPQRDGGYDVADYRDVDPLFGTLSDFDELLARAHEYGLKVIIDLVPNHSSDQHAWFQEAQNAPVGSPARERYIFRDGCGPGGTNPPNNWKSIFGGPAWTRMPHRTDLHSPESGRNTTSEPQWYLHLFDSTQPDLNWDNPEVRQEFEAVLRFWLDKGVDGFRIDVAHGLVKAPGLPDWDGQVTMVEGNVAAKEAAADPGTPEDGSTGATHHGPMFDQDGVHEIYRAWRKILTEYDGDRCLVAEAWVEPLSRLANYVRDDEMHQAFNFSFLTTPWDASRMRVVINASLTAMDAVHAPATWVLSNHDVVRHASRLGFAEIGQDPSAGIGADDPQPDPILGLRRARAATLLMLGLPGSAYLYQGEELGLPDHTTLPDSARQDPTFFRTDGAQPGRDGCRVPLPWVGGIPGNGFGPTGKTWLPQPAVYAELAADQQYGIQGSTYEMYCRALALRHTEQMGSGALSWTAQFADSPDVLAFQIANVTVISNLGALPLALPVGTEVLVASGDLGTSANTVSVPSDTTVWLRS